MARPGGVPRPPTLADVEPSDFLSHLRRRSESMHLNFLYIPVSWVLLRWHQLLSGIGLDPDSGLVWALSIVLLVVTARLLLFPAFVKQVHAQRQLQKLQPRIKELRETHRDDRAELNRQLRKLQDEGYNPLAGCLPMLVQIPVFLGLYHVLRHLSNSAALCNGRATSRLLELYTFSGGPTGETCSAAKANLFGAPLAASFRDGAARIHALGGDLSSTRWVIVALLLGFPLGVLLYWFTSNLWTLAQHAYIIRFHPPRSHQ